MPNRYGINFYNQERDLTAGVYFVSTDYYTAKEEAEQFNKDGWERGNIFFIEEKDYPYYAPVEQFLQQEKFEYAFSVYRNGSQKKLLFREAFETAAEWIANNGNGGKSEPEYVYEKEPLDA